MPIEVLLVEDNAGDVHLMQEAFRDVNPLIYLHIAYDGLEAMAFLRQRGAYVDAPRPDLILLDLNLPKMDGREILAHIKLDADLKNIPTVIVSSSDAEADVAKSYDLHANSYVTKPLQFTAFLKLVQSINDFWLTQSKFPPRRSAAALV
jgi:two-component system, chemotaxis family, response regulator Rcp1